MSVFLASVRARFQDYDVVFPATPGPQTWLILALDDRAQAGTSIRTQTGEASTQPGVRADVLLLATEREDGITLTSVPRKLLVPGVVPELPSVDERIGLAWLSGPQLVVDLFCEHLNVPVDHLVTVDLQAFVDLVDGLGGVSIDVPQGLRDPHTQLELAPGKQTMDGLTALGYARTRRGEVLDEGNWRPESTTEDEGEALRRGRQGDLIAALAARARLVPWKVPGALYAASAHLGADTSTSIWELLTLRTVMDAHQLPTRVDQNLETERISSEGSFYLEELGYIQRCKPATHTENTGP
ncbi:LCP family protein [Buchananella felis]|uniref:LCP family protein n=1 Tax=Buchananella felis TaxID=3231492 RepID=UPI0035282FCF